ncbi:hypothetical protein RxyAA322_28340 [Rubrobacter xylanophilus]|uniref:Muconolactone isomerase domain-containing protein n=1 Tax=Rubrobacter xylanophilus TaxID=49319 RepID=A0A510HLV2_9ACTN|nr:hypothetical protein [Rubrobacter xylanophilus]BBL80980.1 hypothetical protein RxyAA322_28340 [Rubrobacter xylanophilus]
MAGEQPEGAGWYGDTEANRKKGARHTRGDDHPELESEPPGDKEPPAVRFHVTIEAHDSIVLDADRRLRELIGGQLQKIMGSGRVGDAGLLGNKRGACFLVDIDAPEKLYDLFGPEVYGSFTVDSQPVIPVEKAEEIFRSWASGGR